MKKTADKLVKLAHTKVQIGEAIVSKGLSVEPTDTFASYADKITAIDTEVEKVYRESEFDYALGAEGALATMARWSHEETKDWTDYNSASGVRITCLLPLFDTSAITELSGKFANCQRLLALPPIETGQVMLVDRMLYGCSSMLHIPLLDFSSVINTTDTFTGCFMLRSLGGFKNIGVTFYLESSTLLSVESILNVFEHLRDMRGQQSPIVKIGNTNMAKLTPKQMSIATNKNWTIA